MPLVFYERIGHEGRRPSPFSWRIRYALAHKGLDFEVHPVRFADVDRVRALSGQHLTPIIADDGKVVHETWDIACYLEDRFPDRPSLFGGDIGRGLARFMNGWSDTVLGPPLRLVIYADFPAVLDAGDRDYFRSTREKALGMTLEAACADPEAKLAAFQQACTPLERALSVQPYISGKAPAYADYIVFSLFQMARLGCRKDVASKGSAIADWRSRMVGLYDNLGDRFPGYPATG
ncbi:MAG: glutathione S-transferase N-terminal domain-containing protein [Proteobacteria bacterium]|nr:glutathione S-transferase N-terminal domain-containing protein [Pseudomonadota bacterium]